jgi:hypothetical protein
MSSNGSKPARRTSILPMDTDERGNVTLWDHGPPPDSPEAKAWHDANGDDPVPVFVHNSDAAHALAVDPDRWGIEPFDLDEQEVENEIAKIQKARADAKKAAEAREAAAQLNADRAIASKKIQADRAAKSAAASKGTST